MSRLQLRLPRPDVTGMWVFSLGLWFHIVGRLVYRQPWMAFVLSEVIALVLVLWGLYRIVDCWIARVSQEERDALAARTELANSAEVTHDKQSPR